MKLYLIVTTLLLLLFIVDTSYGIGRRRINSTALTATKPADKTVYPKKVTSLKKRPTKSPSTATSAATLDTTTNADVKQTKKPADVTAAFKDLPEDDLAFIKELDKQFKLHGDKIKIKVEHENVTETKNSKRTIDGELGYGHYQNGYEYTRPKFMFYPYSQQDIPSDSPGYYPTYEKTSVTIEPSYSYELKPQTYVEQHEQHEPQAQIDLPHHQNAHGGEAPGHYNEPVIVLRIPGPTKYASHLQTLLQQYLEIRAAQYLQILEQSELQKQHGHEQQIEEHAQHHHHQHHHHQQEQPPPQQHYEQAQPQHYEPAPQHQQQQQQHFEHPTVELQPPGPEQAAHPLPAAEPDYQQEVEYAHQVAPTPQPVHYPAIDDVYQSYKGRHQEQAHQQQPESAAEYYQDAHAYHAAAQQQQQHQQEVPQYYYMQDAPAYAHTHAQLPADHNYQSVFYLAMEPQAVNYEEHAQHQQHHQHQHQQEQPIYVEEEQQVHAHAHAPALSTTENNPRKTHTKVIFTHHSEQSADDYAHMIPLPSIRPYEHHTVTAAPAYHQHYTQQQQPETESAYEHAAVASDHQQQTVAITQRPYNYHAHALKMSAARRQRGARKRGIAAATSSAIVEDPDKKIREYVRDKLGAKTGSTMEFKSTAVVKG